MKHSINVLSLSFSLWQKDYLFRFQNHIHTKKWRRIFTYPKWISIQKYKPENTFHYFVETERSICEQKWRNHFYKTMKRLFVEWNIEYGHR